MLDPAILESGVACALADPDRLRYWVAELDGETQPVGQAAVTREWSDWRQGWIWWFQSVYVARASGAEASSAPCIDISATKPGPFPT